MSCQMRWSDIAGKHETSGVVRASSLLRYVTLAVKEFFGMTRTIVLTKRSYGFVSVVPPW